MSGCLVLFYCLLVDVCTCLCMYGPSVYTKGCREPASVLSLWCTAVAHETCPHLIVFYDGCCCCCARPLALLSHCWRGQAC
jgi:hypothetical protein